MTWMFEFDRDKTQLFFQYLVRSAKKVHQRHVSRARLITQLKKIRSLKIDSKLQEHVDELERRISDMVDAEKKIEFNQAREDLFHRRLIDKINQLDQKIHAFLEHHQSRESRFKEIEKKVYATLSHEQKIARLRGQIVGLEALYNNVLAQKSLNSSQTQAIKDKLDVYKGKLDELEQRSKIESTHPLIFDEEDEHVPPPEWMPSAESDLGPAPPPPEIESAPPPPLESIQASVPPARKN